MPQKNIAIWIAGIMFYKLGLETFQGSITYEFRSISSSLANTERRIVALERWGDEKHRKYGLLRGLDQLFQVHSPNKHLSAITRVLMAGEIVHRKYSRRTTYPTISNSKYPHLRCHRVWVVERDSHDH